MQQPRGPADAGYQYGHADATLLGEEPVLIRGDHSLLK
jgi:hypothetical protein